LNPKLIALTNNTE